LNVAIGLLMAESPQLMQINMRGGCRRLPAVCRHMVSHAPRNFPAAKSASQPPGSILAAGSLAL
jgi:hypothetical protein